MSEQWYCPKCGPRNNASISIINCCNECGRYIQAMDGLPPFVLAMQGRIAELEVVSEKYQEFDPHFVHEAICFYCTTKWVAVAPVGTQELECPECGKMGFARKERVFNIFETKGGKRDE